MIGVPCEGAKRPSGGEGVGRGNPPPTVGTFSKIRVLKSHFRAFKNYFSRELNVVKFHGNELMSYPLNTD